MGTPTAVHVDSLPLVRISTPSKRSRPGRPLPRASGVTAVLHCMYPESHSALHSYILAIFCRIGCTTRDYSAHVKGWPVASRAQDSRSKPWLVVPIQLLICKDIKHHIAPRATAQPRSPARAKRPEPVEEFGIHSLRLQRAQKPCA
jgi:hypothetical protein